jgi:exodeoxyribonuclease VII small subunit
MSFTKDMAELQEIVARLDSGQISLEDSLELFERGVRLVNSCRKYLEEAQQKITLLAADQEEGEGSQWDPLSEDEPIDVD